MKIPAPDARQAATPRQISYIETLAIDLGFTLHRRHAHVEDIIKRKFSFLDELYRSEASQVINQFKEWKEAPHAQTY